MLTMWMRSSTYHGTQHSGDVDRISPPGAVFTGITQVFGIGVQDFEADIQDSIFKLLQKQWVQEATVEGSNALPSTYSLIVACRSDCIDKESVFIWKLDRNGPASGRKTTYFFNFNLFLVSDYCPILVTFTKWIRLLCWTSHKTCVHENILRLRPL